MAVSNLRPVSSLLAIGGLDIAWEKDKCVAPMLVTMIVNTVTVPENALRMFLYSLLVQRTTEQYSYMTVEDIRSTLYTT